MSGSWLTRVWGGFWYRHGSRRNIAMARIIVGLQALWVMLSRDYPAMSSLPFPFWEGVSEASRWRYLLFPGHPQLEAALYWVAVGALIAVVLGIMPRIACVIAGLLLYHIAPLESIIWSSSAAIRGLTIAVPSLILLSASRCGDFLALYPGGKPRATVDFSMDYSWQLRAIQLLLCQIYLFSAIAKLSTSGIAWMDPDNMRNWFLYLTQVPDTAVFSSLGNWIADRSLFYTATGVGTIVFEAGFILVMFSSTLTRVVIPMALAFHILILFAMNVTVAYLPLLLIFVNWDWFVEFLRSDSQPDSSGEDDKLKDLVSLQDRL